VARISRLISEASRFVETARREPFGMSLTLLTTSSPCPGRTTRARIALRSAPVPSRLGGTRPEAITPALTSPR
jgi:hypothetical protein